MSYNTQKVPVYFWTWYSKRPHVPHFPKEVLVGVSASPMVALPSAAGGIVTQAGVRGSRSQTRPTGAFNPW
jgi:hypothetical protein